MSLALTDWFHRPHRERTSKPATPRPEAFRRWLALALARDETRRQRATVTLPGQPAAAPTPTLAPAPALNGQPERRTLRQHFGGRASGGNTPKDEDAAWTYTRAELLQMDRRFTEALERAIANGKESRASAGARLGIRGPRPKHHLERERDLRAVVDFARRVEEAAAHQLVDHPGVDLDSDRHQALADS